MSKKTSYYERFMAMTDAQREAEVARFDKEFVGTPGRPLTAAQKAQLRRARRKGRDAANGDLGRVSVRIDRGLLRRADAFAKATGTSRSELIARGLEVVIGSK